MLTIDTTAEILQATLSGADGRGALEFTSVATDSRAIQPGQLFIALRGDRFDGHDFVAEVLAKGAVAALVDQAWAEQHRVPGTLIAVADTRLALGQLAAAWRRCFAIPVIGVTGSNGKTTVKEMCAAILRAHLGPEAVLATAGNFNNDIGLPLTLLGLRDGHKAAVIEMGMNHFGEISYLTRLAAPTVAVVNNAQRAHLEGLGSLEGVARAKGEIFEGLDQQGVAVINRDDPHCALWQSLAGSHRQSTFGLGDYADVTARIAPGERAGHFSSHLYLITPAGGAELELPVAGLHNARNAAAATAVCLAAGVPLDTIVAALATYGGVKGRLQQKAGLRGARVVDDTYNANPDSMRAAVDVLAALPGKRLFVMGDMGEVGEAGGQFHDELGGYAKSMGIDRLYCLGDLSPAAAHTFGEGGNHYTRVDDLIRAVKNEMDDSTTVLVKGSRFMRMERVVDAITVETTEPGKEHHAA